MKKLALIFATILLIPVFALASDCECDAPDGSCSASATCDGGCYAICISGGSCSSGCDGGSSGPQPENKSLRFDLGNSGVSSVTGEGLRAQAGEPSNEPRISMSAQHLTATDLSGLLSSHLGTGVQFIPNLPTDTYSIDVSQMPASRFMAVLAEFGALSTEGVPPRAEERLAVPSARVSLKLEKTTAGHVAVLLGQLLGNSNLSLHAGNPAEELTLDVDQMDLSTLLKGLQATSTLRLTEAP